MVHQGEMKVQQPIFNPQRNKIIKKKITSQRDHMTQGAAIICLV